MAADPDTSVSSTSLGPFVLAGAEATEALGEALGRAAVAGDVIALEGELGAGKTALVRGIARGLGLTDAVASPTYILMDAHQGGRLPLFHFDAWMEGREKALFLDGGDEWLRAGGLAVIEWAGRVEAWLPTPRLAVELAHLSLAARRVTLRAVEDPAEGAGGLPGRSSAQLWSPRLAAVTAALRSEGP
ncbi:MAG: tRNA (adenosine(37)-N6)-threonylcarbamoyltransferase complex ATPase subunit type 1 TsaE [Planctomycetota bacterium]